MGRNNIVGAWGEALAWEYLRKKRYTLEAAGFHCRFGEIDLIVRNKHFLVFVEVKLRKSDAFARAADHVDPRKQRRLISTASFYLSQHPTELRTRFDVIEIYAPQGALTVEPQIHHLEDAFQ